MDTTKPLTAMELHLCKAFERDPKLQRECEAVLDEFMPLTDEMWDKLLLTEPPAPRQGS